MKISKQYSIAKFGVKGNTYGKTALWDTLEKEGQVERAKTDQTRQKYKQRKDQTEREGEGRSKKREGERKKGGKAEWVRMKGEGVQNRVMKEEERGEKED